MTPLSYEFYLYDFGSQFEAHFDYQKVVVPADKLTSQYLSSFGKPIVYLSPRQRQELPASLKADKAFINFLNSCSLIVSKYDLPEAVAKEITKEVTDKRKAIDLLMTSASQGSMLAQFSLAKCYETGCGMPKRLLDAIDYYVLAAKKGHSLAQFHLGELHEKGENVLHNFTIAEQFYRASANQGCAQSQFALGRFFEEGIEVVPNLEEAAKLYRLAADQGLVVAQVRLGLFCLNGKGVEKDFNVAARLFKLAADQGDAAAIFNLASCFVHGHGVEKNQDESMRLLKLAASKGLEQAKIVLRAIEDPSEETVSTEHPADTSTELSSPKRQRVR